MTKGGWSRLEKRNNPEKKENLSEGKREKMLRKTLEQKVAAGSIDFNTFLQWEVLCTVRGLRTRKGDDSSGEESDEKDVLRGGGKVTRAFGKFQNYRKSIRTKPRRMLRAFDVHVKETLHAEDPGALWSYDEHIRRIKWGKHHAMQRVGLILAEVLKELRSGLVLQASAQTVAAIKACHQVALDDGSWKHAWILAGMVPGSAPGDRLRFAGTETEVEMVANYVKTMDELEKSAKASGGRDPVDPEEDAAKKAEKKAARSKKRQEAAAARKGPL